MATIVCNGCFDLCHEGHTAFLCAAKWFPYFAPWFPERWQQARTCPNRLVIALNSDESARKLKASKWGDRYPIDNQETRAQKLCEYADEVVIFDTEEELRELIGWLAPCIIVKGPDYAGKRVTGDDIAAVIILDTPEPESVKQRKIELYQREPFSGTIVQR
jgi:D-beta-D-heptose 7-phosphate kinase / D-beta-D-heptose 1-phosphate adenosyltransferase